MFPRVLALMFATTSVAVVATSSQVQATTLTASNGAGLRAAIDEANANPAIDLIEVTSVTISVGSGGDVCNDPPFGVDLDNANASGDLDYTGSQDLTIRGTATDRSFLIQNCADRVIDHRGSGTLTLDHLRMAGTIADVPIGVGADPVDYSGGSVRSTGGDLVVIDSLFENGAAGSADATVSGLGSAQSPGHGGAIYAEGDVTVTDSEFTGNAAGNGGDGDSGIAATDGGHGGAIHAPLGTLRITDSTFAENDAGVGGAGADLPGGDGGWGGAIYGKTVVVEGSSFYFERAGDGGDSDDHRGGDGGHGGAIYAEESVTATLTIFNTVLAGWGGTGNVNGGAVTGGAQALGGVGGNGGAVSAPDVEFDRSFITEGYAGTGGSSSGDQGGAGGDGGGIHGQDVRLVDSEIEGSLAGYGGLGPGANGGNGGDGGAISATTTVDITRSYLTANVAGSGGNGNGGGLGGDGGAIGSS